MRRVRSRRRGWISHVSTTVVTRRHIDLISFRSETNNCYLVTIRYEEEEDSVGGRWEVKKEDVVFIVVDWLRVQSYTNKHTHTHTLSTVTHTLVRVAVCVEWNVWCLIYLFILVPHICVYACLLHMSASFGFYFFLVWLKQLLILLFYSYVLPAVTFE